MTSEQISDELQKLKYKEPTSTKIPGLEQELVRAEAQSLVAEAQLTNITRQKLKEAFTIHLAALLERNEKQALLARQAQKLITLLDDTPIVPGESPKPFEGYDKAKAILNDAETELREWTPSWDPHLSDLPLSGVAGGNSASHQEHVNEIGSASADNSWYIERAYLSYWSDLMNLFFRCCVSLRKMGRLFGSALYSVLITVSQAQCHEYYMCIFYYYQKGPAELHWSDRLVTCCMFPSVNRNSRPTDIHHCATRTSSVIIPHKPRDPKIPSGIEGLT